MTDLNCHSLEEALMACYTRYDYKVGIIFVSFEHLIEFVSSMNHQFKNAVEEPCCVEIKHDKISFDTGSSISLIPYYDEWDLFGLSFHRVLYDSTITNKEILKNIYECERLHYDFMNKNNIRSVREIEVDPQPLDDFLSEFSITKI